MTTYIHVDASEVKRELHRLSHVSPAFNKLDREWTRSFFISQTRVHVLTGRLRASGDKSSVGAGSLWRGEMSYGGNGIPVNSQGTDYSYFEWRRGAGHDFFRSSWEARFALGDVVEAQVRG